MAIRKKTVRRRKSTTKKKGRTKKGFSPRGKKRYYELVCANDMMEWVDSLEQLVAVLKKGQKNHLKFRKSKAYKDAMGKII